MDLKKDFYTWGGVHTASYYAEGDHRPNAATRDIMTDFNRRHRGGKEGTTMKYNPNKGVCGYCTNLEGYLQLLKTCADSLELDCLPDLVRIDFRVDCNAKQENGYHYWRKLGEWAVACFATKKNVREKHEGRSVSITTGAFQSAHAKTDGYEVVCYNKALQKKAEGVGYRFEIRRTIKRKKQEDEREVLLKMRDLLRQLPQYAERAAAKQNEKLLKLWHETAPKEGTPRMVNEFVTAHEHDIYTVEQLQRFYEAVGYEKEKAYKARRNYCQRYSRVFVPVTAKELEAFCEMAADYIDKFVNNRGGDAAVIA